MTIVKHELRQGRLAFWIWTGAIAFLLAVCAYLYPEMKGEMGEVGEVFSSMGSFTAAFGMDRLNFGTLTGYSAIEGGNVLGLGGAFYAALTAIGSLSREERDKTAEFLLSHPVTRTRVAAEKLLAVLLQVTALNLIVYAVAVGAIAAVGETIPWKELNLLHLAYFLLQLEIAGICFGLSAFMRKGSLGAGLGIAALFYMINLIANITESASFLKYITPFAYCDGADIMLGNRLDGVRIMIGILLGTAGILAAFLHYPRKDIH